MGRKNGTQPINQVKMSCLVSLLIVLPILSDYFSGSGYIAENCREVSLLCVLCLSAVCMSRQFLSVVTCDLVFISVW